MTERARYDAFLTYSHTDAHEANRLHVFLEHYLLPEKRRLKVYLDRTDLRAGGLAEEITAALESADALVVCCSPAAAGSEWVGREIEAFRQTHGQGTVHLVLLDGEPSAAIPPALRNQELRFIDLRAGRRVGILRPAARVELVRLIAAIAGVDLRLLIPWDKRRRWRRAATVGGVVTLVAALGMAVPVATWSPLTLGAAIPAGYRIDAAETRDGELVVVSRMPPTSERGYVTVWHGVPGTNGQSEWLELNFNPRSRLVPVDFADSNMIRRAGNVLSASITSMNNLWIGEPLPDHFIAIQRQPPPDDYTPLAGDALEGSSDVWTAMPGESVRHAVVDELYPETTKSSVARTFDVSSGVPVGWGSSGIWIGTPTHTSYTSSGGLWHSKNGGATWAAISGFRSVQSILVDEPEPGKVLVTEIRRPVPVNVIISNAPVERSRIAVGPAEGEWPDFPGPPHGEADILEVVGRLPDGPLVVRVDQVLHAQSRMPFVNWLRSRP